MVGKFKPLRFGSWGERAKRADNPVTRPPLGGHRLNEQMIGVSLAPESAFSALDKQWCLYIRLHSYHATK